MMLMEAGNISRFSKPVPLVSIGTRIMPPPAPNNPLIIPATAPAIAVKTVFLRKKSPPVEKCSTGGDPYS